MSGPTPEAVVAWVHPESVEAMERAPGGAWLRVFTRGGASAPDGWRPLVYGDVPAAGAVPEVVGWQKRYRTVPHESNGWSEWSEWQPCTEVAYRNIQSGLMPDRQSRAVYAGALPAGFLAHVASVCRGAVEFCEAKPQRAPEDAREHNGGLCLNELACIADQIDAMLRGGAL